MRTVDMDAFAKALLRVLLVAHHRLDLRGAEQARPRLAWDEWKASA